MHSPKEQLYPVRRQVGENDGDRTRVDSSSYGGRFFRRIQGVLRVAVFARAIRETLLLFVTMYCVRGACGVLSFGLPDSFGGRSFHPPLLILHGVTLVCMLVRGF